MSQIVINWRRKPAPTFGWEEAPLVSQYFASPNEALAFLEGNRRDPGFLFESGGTGEMTWLNASGSHVMAGGICLKCEHMPTEDSLTRCPTKVYDP